MELVEQVERHWKAGELTQALRVAFERWRATRAPEVAGVLQAIVAEALPGYDAPRARGKDEFQRAWLQAAEDPAPLTTAWLGATLTRQLQIEADYGGILRRNYAQTKYAAYFDRLKALERRAPDPLVAAALVELLREAPFSAWDRRGALAIYQPVFDLLVRCGDVRQVAALEQLHANPRAPRAVTRELLVEALPAVISTLREVEVRLSIGERSAWAALVPSARVEAAGHGDRLLEQVYATPDADEPRLVYADWLTERGDPRGELIALQVQAALGRADAKALKRAGALLREHRDAWLGELAQVLTHVELHRGFLDSFELAQNAAATEEVWARATQDPRLRTVRGLRKGRGNTEHFTRFALSPQMANLRVVEIPVSSTLEALCAGPPRRVEELILLRLPTAQVLAKLAATAALPALKKLTIATSDDPDVVRKRVREAGLQKYELELEAGR